MPIISLLPLMILYSMPSASTGLQSDESALGGFESAAECGSRVVVVFFGSVVHFDLNKAGDDSGIAEGTKVPDSLGFHWIVPLDADRALLADKNCYEDVAIFTRNELHRLKPLRKRNELGSVCGLCVSEDGNRVFWLLRTKKENAVRVESADLLSGRTSTIVEAEAVGYGITRVGSSAIVWSGVIQSGDVMLQSVNVDTGKSITRILDEGVLELRYFDTPKALVGIGDPHVIVFDPDTLETRFTVDLSDKIGFPRPLAVSASVSNDGRFLYVVYGEYKDPLSESEFRVFRFAILESNARQIVDDLHRGRLFQRGEKIEQILMSQEGDGLRLFSTDINTRKFNVRTIAGGDIPPYSPKFEN